MRKYLPNLLSALRASLSLLLFALAPFSPIFFALYALCGLSDMLDGFLARRLNCESAFGARLDSLADFLFPCLCSFPTASNFVNSERKRSIWKTCKACSFN